MVFPVVMYGCESWSVKKAKCRRIDAFELWCWRRLLRVPWTAKRSNQSILKEISPGCSLEGLMLKLKLQFLATWCEDVTHLKRPWCWEGLRAGGEGDDRAWDGWMASPTQWTWVWVDSGSWWWAWRPGVLQFMGSRRVRHDWAAELNWTMTPHIVSKEEIMNLEPQFLLKEGNVLPFTFSFFFSFSLFKVLRWEHLVNVSWKLFLGSTIRMTGQISLLYVLIVIFLLQTSWFYFS